MESNSHNWNPYRIIRSFRTRFFVASREKQGSYYLRKMQIPFQLFFAGRLWEGLMLLHRNWIEPGSVEMTHPPVYKG
jgi:hypothetical protein